MSAVAELEPPTTKMSKKSTAEGGTGGREKRATAETMAKGQRDISVSEFFAKNRHLLGFDNPRKALLTTVKEAVDNSLDACEEARDSPRHHGRDRGPAAGARPRGRSSRGTGSRSSTTVRASCGSRSRTSSGGCSMGRSFTGSRCSRGQQGIGISAAGMYGLITTGKPMVIQTRPEGEQEGPPHRAGDEHQDQPRRGDGRRGDGRFSAGSACGI